ncbi:uncharacterized protein [Apostichopus japonicus]|uniref:uncharacterized protein isoform X1 n=1 Tax=Stichopus japonicus TaxID=307972 RepID=UPI003AB71BFF
MAILDTGFLIALTILLTLSSATSAEVTECAQTQYVEIGTVGLILCSCNGSSMALIAWVNVNEGKTLLLLHDDDKRGDGYESGEFDIYPNGSLLINNVTASHESVYRVSTAISISGFRISKNICVQTTVKPAITIPAIEECSNTYGTTCIKSTADSVEVNCFVRDSRPAVKLSWTIRTHGGDRILPSNYINFTTNNVTYTSHVTATFSFGESSVLSLLVCRANSVPLNLVEEEKDFLVEKEIDYTSLATPIRIYLKIHSPMNLSCTDLRLNIVVWKWSPQQDAFETLYVSIFEKSNHTKISNKEYKLGDEGSLSLQNTLVEHEGLYACVYDNGVSGGIVLYDVLVMVDPTPVFPFIDGCNHQQYCVLEKQPQDVLTCSVLGIRPKVALEWRAFREETTIDFTQHQLTVTQISDLYDISLTVNFDFTLTTQNKVTVECRAVGENAELFSLSTKVDLLFPNVLSTEQRSNASTITIIAVLVTVIIITAVVVIVCKIRARKMKMKRFKRGDTENEGIAVMENDYSEKAEAFIGQLKSKYEIFYDSVQPIPYIKDRMYCVDRVFVEGGIEYMTGISGGKAQWGKLSSYQELVKENCLKTKRQILEGEPGYGKSTLTLQLLYDWCKSLSTSPLKKVDVIIYLRLRQLGGVKSIFSAIRQFILPRDSDISEEDIQEILKQMKSVLVLLDGFDEYPDQESTETDIYHIMKKNMFRRFNVILTTRPSCVPTDFAPHSDRVRLTGFGEEARRRYVEKAVVGTYGEAVDRIMRKLEENPVLDDLCQVPLFFVMFAHMANKDEHSLTFNSVTSFFRYMISCFHSHMKNKMKDENVTNFELLEKEHKVLDKLAFEALSGKNQNLVWNREQLRNQLGHDFYDQYLRIGIFVEEEELNIADSPNAQIHIQYNTEVHFYHKTVCEWYAAHYVAEELSGGNNVCIDELLQNLDPFDLQYLYRFACGINKIAGQKVIQYLQEKKESRKFAILCMLEEEDKTDIFLKSVSDIVSTVRTDIKKEDSKLLQRSTIQILDIASKNQIPILHLYLQWSFSGFDGEDIRLESGLCLSSLSSVQKIHINVGGTEELSEEDVIGLINYGIKSLKFKTLWLGNCKLPSSIKPDNIPEEASSRNVKVISSGEACYLDFKSGKWSKPDDIQTIAEMCSGDLSIKRDISESVQRSVIEILVEASNHDIPIHCVNLVLSFSEIDEDGNIILSSGLSLPILTSIEELFIQTDNGSEMNEHEVNGILNYVQHSQRFKKLYLSDCLLPSSIPIGPSLSALKSRDVTVVWIPDTNKLYQSYLLDQESGGWLEQ